jgi:hypothetical protein
MIPNRHQQQSNAHNRSTACDEILPRAAKLIAEKKYQKAVDLLNAKGLRESSHQNMKGVCLMRLGLYDDAVRLFRSLVMVPGSTQIRQDAPVLHKINFATALLLSGCASGCTEVLTEIHQDQDPYVRQVRAAIDNWVSQMTILQKLSWWTGRIEPVNRPVKIDFEPGDLGIDIKCEDSPKPDIQPAALKT